MAFHKLGIGRLSPASTLLISSISEVLLRINHSNMADDANVAIYFSLIAIFGGLGLLISHLIEKREFKEENNA